jgi:hypothetical protein
VAATDPRILVLASVLLLAGCPANGIGDDPPADPTPTPTPSVGDDDDVVDPAPEMPEGLDVPAGHLFSVDATRSVFALPIAGDPSHELIGRLADSDGRREILYGPTGESDQVVVPAAWVLPAVASLGPTGVTALCWSALTGNTSELTEGAMPDPTQGVSLFCRVLRSDGWSEPVRMGSHGVAAWIMALEPQPNGDFEVQYWSDEGWLVRPTTLQDGLYSQMLLDGEPGKSEVVELVSEDQLDLGDPNEN